MTNWKKYKWVSIHFFSFLFKLQDKTSFWVTKVAAAAALRTTAARTVAAAAGQRLVFGVKVGGFYVFEKGWRLSVWAKTYIERVLDTES